MKISGIPVLLSVWALWIWALTIDNVPKRMKDSFPVAPNTVGVIWKVTRNADNILTIITDNDGKIVCINWLSNFPRNTETVLPHSQSYEARKGFWSLKVGDKVRIIESADRGYLQIDWNKETLFLQSPQKWVKVVARKYTLGEKERLLSECWG